MKKFTIKLLFALFSLTFLLGFTPDSFSETELKTVIIFVDPPNDLPIDEGNKNSDDKKPTPENSPNPPNELPTEFVTGNEYALNGNSIFISSDEGIFLNNLLIDQIDTQREDTKHTGNFWSRTDQMIMGNFGVVNALQNPLSENNYHIGGKAYAENVNSNLEYFVKERGYTLDNLENVPNHMLTPKKYDLSRAVSKEITNPLSSNLDVQHVRDLRDVSPNAFDFTPEQQMQMFRESVKSTSFLVVGSLMPTLMVDESWFQPESTIKTNPSLLNEEKQDGLGKTQESQKQEENRNKIKNEKLFQETSHIKDIIISSEFEPSYETSQKNQIPFFEIITSLMISITSTFTIYLILNYYRRASQTLSPPICVETKYDYLTEVEGMILDANSLYQEHRIKDAYEKFSQSIRVFYSNKLGLEKEIVTSELIPLMENFNKSEKSLVKDSLYLSDMIEFAKHSENTQNFVKLLAEFLQVIRNEKRK